MLAYKIRASVLQEKHIRPDGVNWIPETECCPEATALLFSSDLNDLDRAKEFAKTEDYTVYVMVDSDDVLTLARNKIMKQKG